MKRGLIVKITSASEAICLFYNHQWRDKGGAISELMVRVQYTAKGGSGATWLGLELGDLCRYYKKLPAHHQVWGEYNWGSVGDCRAKLRNHVISMIVPAVKEPEDAKLDIIKLCHMTLADYEHRESRKTIKYNLEQLDNELGHIDRWHPKYQKAYKIINQLSADCLGAIARRMHEVAEIDEAV